MESALKQEKQKSIWDIKYEEVQERIKESIWAGFIIRGLLTSGIIIIKDNYNLPQESNILIDSAIVTLVIIFIIGGLRWVKYNPFQSKKNVNKAQKTNRIYNL